MNDIDELIENYIIETNKKIQKNKFVKMINELEKAIDVNDIDKQNNLIEDIETEFINKFEDEINEELTRLYELKYGESQQVK